MVTVAGGGLSGQAGAVRHGLSKALTYYEPDLRAGAEEGRLPDPQLARGRAQEVRQAQGSPQLPVLEALISVSFAERRAKSPPFCFVRHSFALHRLIRQGNRA